MRTPGLSREALLDSLADWKVKRVDIASRKSRVRRISRQDSSLLNQYRVLTSQHCQLDAGKLLHPARRRIGRTAMPAVKKADTAAEERDGGGTSTSGGAGDEPLPLGSKFPGLQPCKVKEAVAALLKYVGAQQESEKALFQEDEMLYLVRT